MNQIFDDEAFLDKSTKSARSIYWTVVATWAQSIFISTTSSNTEAGTTIINAHNAELKDNY